jgi:hypothetical protein
LFPSTAEITHVPLNDPSLAWLPVLFKNPLNTIVWFTCHVPATIVCCGANVEMLDVRETVPTMNGPFTKPPRPMMIPAVGGKDPQFPPHCAGSVSTHHVLCGDAPADACSAA